jgi:CheY-like chemotaxis protein
MSAGNVVVVDDTAINRMLLGGILEDAGYAVRVASGGMEAIAMIEREPPDLVLLDIQMPEMNGYQVCRRLKALPRLAAIPVIFISALDEVSEKLKGFEAGGVDYVTKPFESAEVLARVGSQVKLFRLQRELRERNVELQRRNADLMRANEKTERVFLALSDALPGTVLDDTYRLEVKIGEGGFGAVFRGLHLGLQRPVAVKVLRPATANAPGELARFRREGIAACRIAHPNAVEVIDFSVSSNGIAYLVMELLRGRTLGALLRETPIVAAARCVEIIGPVCDALAAAHAAGIVHRDIKPDNVILHQAGGGEVVKVVDFGIARLMDEKSDDGVPLTRHGGLVGTPLYMAPERLLGRPYDERSDVYSVGVLAYLMLTGAMPFPDAERPDMPEMVKMHLTAKPKPLREANPDVSVFLADTVMRALDPEPGLRPTAVELAVRVREAR